MRSSGFKHPSKYLKTPEWTHFACGVRWDYRTDHLKQQSFKKKASPEIARKINAALKDGVEGC
jgi:hypothetical protein